MVDAQEKSHQEFDVIDIHRSGIRSEAFAQLSGPSQRRITPESLLKWLNTGTDEYTRGEVVEMFTKAFKGRSHLAESEFTLLLSLICD